MERHESVGDVRGRGHFWAVEIVKNRKTKEPFDTRADKFGSAPTMADTVATEALNRGLYIHNWYDHLTVAPPLIITKEQVESGLEIFDEVLEIADRETER